MFVGEGWKKTLMQVMPYEQVLADNSIFVIHTGWNANLN
jgi:hypothetical protein